MNRLITLLKNYKKYFLSLDRTEQTRVLFVVLSGLILFFCTLYASAKSSEFFATASDALVYTYLVGDGLKLHQIVLPDQHANILKLPIFFLQSLFPYNYDSFMFLNILLVLIAVGAWAGLLIKLFGKRYSALIFVLFSTLLLSSSTLNINLTEDTIRNIEFPIALWFIFIVNDVLRGARFTRWKYAISGLGLLLYALTLAGDNYFQYATTLPLIMVIFWYWLQSREFTKRMWQAVGVIVGVSIFASVIKFSLIKSGLIVIDNTAVYATTIVPYNVLGASVTTAFAQLLSMQGAFIFGQNISAQNIAYFVNFGLLIAIVIAFCLILKKANRGFIRGRDLTEQNNIVLAVIALSFFTVFVVYIFSGQVVQLTNGRLVNHGELRYIAYMPLLGLVALIWLIKTYYSKHRRLIAALFVISFIELITLAPSIRQSYDSLINSAEPTRVVTDNIVGALEKDKVNDVLTSYTYGAPIRFWSDSRIRYAPIINCNTPFYFNDREDWFKADGDTHTALVIDRPSPFWDCSNKQLLSIYGQPTQEMELSLGSGATVDIWVYNYDIRTKLMPFSDQY